ncbi:MAG: alpha/beta hydrolase [Eubacterium sp.]|nr:alpha/beta hydrolase [Eubacterium sp.]
MNPVFIPIIATVACLVLAFLIMKLVTRKRKKEGKLTKKRQVFITLGIFLFFWFGGGFVYFSIYTHATDNALKFMESDSTVKVSENDTGYFFDGPGNESAFIFYPGAKVDEKAYAELMHGLASDGVDCFLISMPFHMAFMGSGKANDVIEKGGYKKYYVGGHSLGGAILGQYLEKNTEKVNGVAFIAAYSTAPVSDRLSVVQIKGSNDGVINWNDVNKYDSNLPKNATKLTIEGGNHSQFGDYGLQRGDNEATILRDEQLRQTKDAIEKMISA